jgi:CxxC motif-containing protein
MTELTCTLCPIGCRVRVEREKEELIITGNRCPRGIKYALEEITAPKRVLTAVVQMAGGGGMLPGKTKTAIPKEKIFSAMEEVKALTVQPPVMIGQVLSADLAGTGVPFVATGGILEDKESGNKDGKGE